jgi:hypothetical protein
MRWISVISTLLGAFTWTADASTNAPFATVEPLLKEYCFKCHSGARAKGGVNLQAYTNVVSVYREPKTWQTILEQIHDRQMPPDGKPQPSDEQRELLTSWIKQTLDNLDHGAIPKDPGRVMIHRLSRLEYNNTVRDLFGITNRPADSFPADGGGGAGFDNIAETLFVPPILMERFLAAADEVLSVAKPEVLFVSKPGPLRSSRAAAVKVIEHWAPRIFRRPVDKDELKPILELFERAAPKGQTFEAGVKLSLKAMLVSPKFLFRIEEEQPVDDPYRVGDYELATRLSYFLWSSMPDDELFKLAAGKQLGRRDVLEKQVRRMLASPKAEVFVENFAGQWLHIRELTTSAQPDQRRFPEFTPELREAMMREPIALFGAVLRQDGNLLDLLHSDYTFLNEALAKHYGIDGVEGAEFRRVSLTNQNRGGVLGTAAVLTLTSYPGRTSPVLRGKWVLEELLGTPPPPPPPLVATLPRDDSPRDGLTFRQQLEKHRADPNCAGCHKRMDPLGLGLENFDAIGRWRSEIKGVAVDASGVLVTGEKFDGPAELKKLLVERKGLFTRNVSEKMLSYALGRGLDYYDTPEVKRIAHAVEKANYRGSVLVTEIVKSYPFQFRRNRPPGDEAARSADRGMKERGG